MAVVAVTAMPLVGGDGGGAIDAGVLAGLRLPAPSVEGASSP